MAGLAKTGTPLRSLDGWYADLVEEVEAAQSAIKSAVSGSPRCKICTLDLKGQNGTLNGPLSGVLILKLLGSEPSITQKEASEQLNIPLRTLKRRIASLQEKGLLEREGSKKTGRWVVVASADERRGEDHE